MQFAVEYFLTPPLISSACIRARFAARICASVIVCANEGVATISQRVEAVIRILRMVAHVNPVTLTREISS